MEKVSISIVMDPNSKAISKKGFQVMASSNTPTETPMKDISINANLMEKASGNKKMVPLTVSSNMATSSMEPSHMLTDQCTRVR